MLKILKWPLSYIIIQFLLIILLYIIYFSLGNDINLFNQFLHVNQIYLVVTLALIFIPLLTYEYNKSKHNDFNGKVNKLWALLISGIILSLFYNILAFYVNFLLKTNLYDSNTKMITTLIATGFIGPIIEELLFRGVMYNEAKKRYPNTKAIWIVNICFALCHFNVLQMFYAFILGFILIYVYEKYKTIKAPIIVHMASNITTTCFLPLLIKNYFWVNYIIFIICIVCFSLYKKHTKKTTKL